MRLYEVTSIDVRDEISGLTEDCDVLIPTDETYANTEAFLTRCRNHGELYEGKTWKLLSERGEEQTITIKRETIFSVDVSGGEGKAAA